MDEALLGTMLASTLRLATPLIFCALAGLFSERSGVVDIGLEGKMLFAAFAAGAAGAVSGSTTLALLAAVGVAVTLSWMHGLACVGDQVVSGVAINIIVDRCAGHCVGGKPRHRSAIQPLLPQAATALAGIPGSAACWARISPTAWSIWRCRWCVLLVAAVQTLACVCVPSVKIRKWWMPQVCRSRACATRR
jgi:ABC-type uncharacterized transport system permease subunit